MEETYDVAVAGAGLAGPTAAATAAAEGRRVVVLDAHQPGGNATTTERDGFRLNLGAHALYLGGPGRRILADLGITPAGGPPASPAWALAGGRVQLLPTSTASLVRTRLLGAREKTQLSRVLLGLRRVDAAAHGHETVGAWLAGLDLGPGAAGVLELLVRVSSYTNAPDVLSADAAISQLQVAIRDGVSYLHGGWRVLVDGLLARCRVAGVEFRTGAAVTSVEPVGPAVVLAVAGDSVRARAAVLAVGGPEATARLLPVEPAFSEGLGPPAAVACLDLGLTAPPDRRVLFSVDAPLYLSTHTPPADLAPVGRSLVAVMRYLAPDEHPAPDAQHAELLAHGERAGIHREDIVLERYLHRMTAISAIPTAAAGGLAGRPGTTIEDVPGVFVAGDWVGPVGLLSDASMASAVVAGAAAARSGTLAGR